MSGIVVREDKQDPARATNGDRVMLRGTGGTAIIEFGEGGAFEFSNVRPGAYTIVVGPRVTIEPVAVVVSDKDVSGLRVLIPDVAMFTGNVIVENGGPRPRFQLVFSRLDGPGVAPVNVSVGATFAMQLHTGRYRITANGLPVGYSLKSATQDTTDVLSQPLQVVRGDPDPISVALGVSSPAPWVNVSGRVTNGGAMTTPIESLRITSPAVVDPLTAAVAPDGSFEFTRVIPGAYTAIALPATPVSSSVPFTVGAGGETNLAIRIPEPREVNGQIVLQGNVPMPSVAFTLTAPGGTAVAGGTTNIRTSPLQNGSFQILLPQGQRQITVIPTSIPPGYKLTSFTYGSTDLLKNPLEIATTDKAELRVSLDATSVTTVNVSGRVVGLLTTQAVRVVMASPILRSVESPVNPDGSFSFSRVIPGNYNLRLSLSGLSAGRTISVGERDLTDITLVNPREFVVTGHTIVEGGSAVGSPVQVVLDAKSAALSRASSIINSEVIMLNLRDGEYNISVRSVSPGYQIKSIMYGTTDLQKEPLKVDGPMVWEIVVRLVPTPSPGK